MTIRLKSTVFFSMLFLILMYSPVFGQTWEQLGDTPFNIHHNNGFGLDDKAYVFEGNSDVLWEYDSVTDNWKQIGVFPGGSRGFAIGDDWKGKYYYGFGTGSVGDLSDLWVFDPVDTSFTQLATCPAIGRLHPALIAHNDKVYMGAGSNSDGNLNDWWEYDMATDVWTQKPNIPGNRRHHPFQFAMDDYIYVGGGHVANWFRYDPQFDLWLEIDNTPQGRVAGTQFSYDGFGFVLGGDDTDHETLPLNEVFMAYSPENDDWIELPSLPNGSRWACSSVIINNEVYFFGGYGPEQFSTDVSVWKMNLEIINCLPPIDLNVVNVDSFYADISYEILAQNSSDTLKWRKVGEPIWNIVVDPPSVLRLDDLSPCENYEFQVFSGCQEASSNSEIEQFTTTGCGPCIDLDFCRVSPLLNGDVIFLNRVQINDYINVSGNDNGYGNFSASNGEDLGQGQTFNLIVEIGGDFSNQQVKAWIDFDVDGDFEDDELVVDNFPTSFISAHAVNIPIDANVGLTRMRVIVGNGIPFLDACTNSSTLEQGEAEDYCINIVGLSSTDNPFGLDDESIQVFPNPFNNTLNFKTSKSVGQSYQLSIKNSIGQTVKTVSDFSLNSSLDLGNLNSGLYFLSLEKDGFINTFKVFKQD